jgi:Sec-independent protein translocase protein TatA
MELFGVGIGEAALVLLITLLVVGPERFPQIAREGGKYYRMARRFTAEVTGDLSLALKELENEVSEQTGDLKAVREIGNEVRAGVTESATDIDSISRGAAAAASTDRTDTLPSAAAPEARRETEVAQPMGAPPMTVPVGGDPFARVAAVYGDYHTPPPAPVETPEARADRIVGVNPFGSAEPPVTTPSSIPVPAPSSIPVPAPSSMPAPAPALEAASEVDSDELSRQAAEAFEEFRKPVAPPAPVPYSPQQIVGVNPFASADPPMVASAPAPAPAAEPAFASTADGAEAPADGAGSASTGSAAAKPASGA